MSEFTRVEVNGTAPIGMPTITYKPKEGDPELVSVGERGLLIPGGNNIETKYLTALEQPEYDGLRKAWKKYQDRGMIKVFAGKENEAEIKKPEGPPAPESLATYPEATAILLAENTEDREALKRWSKDERAAVAKAARAKLQGLPRS